MRKKKFFKSMLGVVCIGGGIYLFYLFLNTLNEGGNYLYFGLSILLATVATYAFLQANKTVKLPEQDLVIDPNLQFDKTENLLQKNNEMAAQYGKTMKAREELKMLELANTPNKE